MKGLYEMCFVQTAILYILYNIQASLYLLAFLGNYYTVTVVIIFIVDV